MLYHANAYRLYETVLVSYTRGGAAGRRTDLQAGRSWDLIPMGTLEIFINIILSASL